MSSRRPAPISRRRTLSLIAGATAVLAAPSPQAAPQGQRWMWRGTALGADATLVLHHPHRRAAEEALAACLAEVERLEQDFSLHRPNSALSRLNREGVLAAPSLDMLSLLQTAIAVSAASLGAFDVTVQPLWRLYAEHFTANPGDSAGPAAAAIGEALHRVDYRRLTITPDRITLPAGMAVTLNGIAQGYITDRIADLLRRRGWTNVLIDLGEIRTLDDRPDGTPWRIARDRPARPAADRPVLAIRNRAVATSAGAGMTFSSSGRHHHLFDPRTGQSACICAQVTVVAGRATLADALSTALFATPPDGRLPLLRRFAGSACEIVETDGSLARLTA